MALLLALPGFLVSAYGKPGFLAPGVGPFMMTSVVRMRTLLRVAFLAAACI
jgi:hypothetical protein